MAQKNRPLREKDAPLFLSYKKGLAKWGLIIFVSAWTFVLGILVGRETAPVKFSISEIEKKLADLKSEVIGEEKKKFDVLFHEELKNGGRNNPKVRAPSGKFPKSRDESSSSRPSDEKKGKSDKIRELPAKTGPDIKSYTKPDIKKKNLPEQEKLPERLPPLKIKKKEELPPDREIVKSDEQSEKNRTSAKSPKSEESSVGKSKTRRKITIQVASFRKPKDARKLITELSQKGYDAYMTSAEIPGKGFYYRVNIGAFRNKAAAGGVMKRLRAAYPNSFFSRLD